MANITLGKCSWRGCNEAPLPGKLVCERHASPNPARFKPKPPPTIDTATKLLGSPSKAKRLSGMKMLCELWKEQLILQHALCENDPEVLWAASNALEHHPVELVQHLLTRPSSDLAGSYLRFHVASNNFLYAENVIRNVLTARKQLKLKDIESIGGACFKSLEPALLRHLKGELQLVADALASEGSKAGVGVDSNCWSRQGTAAVNAAIALARIDAKQNNDRIEQLLNRANAFQHRLPVGVYEPGTRNSAIAATIHRTRMHLEVALLATMDRSTPTILPRRIDEYTDLYVAADLGTVFLKRGEIDALRELAAKCPLPYLISDFFCHWPILDWLQSEGILPQQACADGFLKDFWKARSRGVQPPPWWQWMK